VTSRAPAAYKEPGSAVPRRRGRHQLLVRQRPPEAGQEHSIAFINKAGEKIPYYGADMELAGDRIGGRKEDVHAAATEAKPRVELLDENGHLRQIVYPNIMGFRRPRDGAGPGRGPVLPDLPDLQRRDARVAGRGQERLLPQAMLPFWDIEQSIAEAKRAKASA